MRNSICGCRSLHLLKCKDSNIGPEVNFMLYLMKFMFEIRPPYLYKKCFFFFKIYSFRFVKYVKKSLVQGVYQSYFPITNLSLIYIMGLIIYFLNVYLSFFWSSFDTFFGLNKWLPRICKRFMHLFWTACNVYNTRKNDSYVVRTT